MNASSDRKKPPAESQRHLRESHHPHKYRTRPTAKVEPHRISDHREASVRRPPDVPHRGVKYFNWYPASSSTEDNEDTFNLDVRFSTEGDIPQWQDSPSRIRTRIIPELPSVHRDLPLPPLAQPCTSQPKPCTTTLVNESRHPEEFLVSPVKYP
ncbi:hypothetical protein CRM22_009493 [Opisthorchis felineus]|uniref:Uncharacterized protein n=1 Tax=Opisthorchis felineus TaxID=147828 RepID=A0A4S2L6S7_OPIFE|nr:hypothetical protein CRM22_009493 [Opisthorchis felineus]